jgi:hemerythrin-like domain-containing protein
MELPHELRRLRYEHAQIRELGAAIRAVISQPNSEELQKLRSIRLRFDALLVRHLKCEDWILYPRISASLDRDISHLGDRVFSQYGDLADRLMEYMDQWTGDAIHADWDGHRSAVEALLDHAERRAVAEEQILFPAVAQDYATHRRVG